MYNNYSEAYPKKEVKIEKNITKNDIYTSDIIDVQHLNGCLNKYKIVVVKAWASWCEPCKLAGVKIEALAKQLDLYIKNNYIIFLNENINNENSLHKNKLEVVPTFFIYYKGKLASVFNGLEFDKFQDKIVEYLNKDENYSIHNDNVNYSINN